MSKNILITAVVAGLLFGFIGYFVGYDVGFEKSKSQYTQNYSNSNVTSSDKIDSFEECAAGNPIQESYPRGCIANGQTFVEIIE